MSDYSDVYKAPVSDIQVKGELPVDYPGGALTIGKLKFLGWMSLFYLLSTLPVFGLSILSSAEVDNDLYKNLADSANLLNAMIFIYLIWKVKAFLNNRFKFHQVDRHIIALVMLTAIFSANTLFMPDDAAGSIIYGIVDLILIVIYGLALLLFGKRLLLLKQEYPGLKLYAWTSLVTGVLMMTIVLLVLAVFIDMIASFSMMLMFFAAARELRGGYSLASEAV